MGSFWDFVFAKRKTLYTEMSGSNKLSIVEWGNERILFFNNIPYSKLTRGSLYTASYYDFFVPLPSIYKKDKVRVLIIGMGGGTMPYQLKGFYGKKLEITAVEPDKKVIGIAKRFIPNGLDGIKVVNMGGFEYLESASRKYDLIILDAFVRDHIPGKFYSPEFIKMAKNSLEKDGILAINFAFHVVKLPGYLLRLKKQFNVYTMKHILFGNYIIICSKSLDKDEILKRIDLDLVDPSPLRSIRQLYEMM
jgi:spermidine synthase